VIIHVVAKAATVEGEGAEPATKADIDHTIPYTDGGPTQASNLKCLCRKHHLIKTFWGWRDQQLPDGTIIWTSPAGDTNITTPGCALLLPALYTPTAAVPTVDEPPTKRDDACNNAMPQRRITRAQSRVVRLEAERRLNREDHDVAQSRIRWQETLTHAAHGPPPF